MPNDFYTPTGNPSDNSNIVSADMRAEFAAINAGFNKLPTLTGNANKLVVINSSGTGMDVTTAPTGLTSINKVAITQPANGATFTLLDGKTLTVNNTLTLAGTDGTVMTFPATNATLARTDAANTFTGIQDFDGRIDANAGLAVAGANFTSRGITDSATALALMLSGSGANSITIANSATNPIIGTSAGALLVAPATGFMQLNGVTAAGLVINAATGNVALCVFYVNGTEVGRVSAAAANAVNIGTSSTATQQVSITHTASADRYITLTGSNGGNPTIGTSAGYIGLTSGTVLTDGLLYGWGATPTAWIAGSSASNVIGLYTSSAEQVRIASVPFATKRLGLYGGAAGNAGVNVSSGSLELGSPVVFVAQTVGTTVGAAGGASALPATPLGYLTTSINGSACKIPYYN